jgi:hypothetical protein
VFRLVIMATVSLGYFAVKNSEVCVAAARE